MLAAGGVPRLIPSTADKRFQLSAQDVAQHWTPATQGVLVASPSNPTGTSIAHGELAELLAQVRARDGFAIVDEIYLGLSYEGQPRSALTLDDDVIVINSFSKYFHMTGWRLGWMIVPDGMVEAVEKIASSLAICAPTLAQHAALACFTDDALKTFAHRREAFKQRRDYLLPEFERLGLRVPVPDGAFYIYADISDLGMDSAAPLLRAPCRAWTSVRPTATTPCASPMPPAWTAWKRPSIAWASCWVTEPAFGFHESNAPLGARFLAGARPDRDQSLASAMPDASARRRRSACTLAP